MNAPFHTTCGKTAKSLLNDVRIFLDSRFNEGHHSKCSLLQIFYCVSFSFITLEHQAQIHEKGLK